MFSRLVHLLTRRKVRPTRLLRDKRDLGRHRFLPIWDESLQRLLLEFSLAGVGRRGLALHLGVPLFWRGHVFRSVDQKSVIHLAIVIKFVLAVGFSNFGTVNELTLGKLARECPQLLRLGLRANRGVKGRVNNGFISDILETCAIFFTVLVVTQLNLREQTDGIVRLRRNLLNLS